MRPSTSVPPPAANGTTMVTARVGQLWAAAGLTPSTTAAEASKASRIACFGRMESLRRFGVLVFVVARVISAGFCVGARSVVLCPTGSRKVAGWRSRRIRGRT